MKMCKMLKKRDGAALVWVLMIFAILMIFMTSIVYVTNQDIRETRMQEERLQTYYIALAGIDLTYAALMDPNEQPLRIEGVINTLKADSTPIEDVIPMKVGKSVIKIDRVEHDETYWIRITSIGKLEDKSTKVTTTMIINEENQNQIIREKFGDY